MSQFRTVSEIGTFWERDTSALSEIRTRSDVGALLYNPLLRGNKIFVSRFKVQTDYSNYPKTGRPVFGFLGSCPVVESSGFQITSEIRT